MKLVKADELRSKVTQVFVKHGVPEKDSYTIADVMVHANLRGVDSHGVIRVPHYIARLENGTILPNPEIKVEQTGPSTATMDGGDGYGHVAMAQATELAIKLSDDTGVGFVGINHSSHCGALSYFGEMAIAQNKILFAFSQTDGAVVPFGGRKPFAGTNPLCFAAPSAEGTPIILDMATSTVAGGHIFKARTDKKPIPLGWGLDKDGNPTTDPVAAIYFTPAGGPKGYGLGIFVDVLTGILSGGTYGPHVVPMYNDMEHKRDLCHLVGVLDIKRFAGAVDFKDKVTAMTSEIHQIPPAEGFKSVLAPGEPEYLRSLDRSENGIPLEDYVWENIEKLS